MEHNSRQPNGGLKRTFVTCQTPQGWSVRGTVLKLSRFEVLFEEYSPEAVFHASEVLNDFTVILNETTIYSGQATIRNVISTGQVTVCAVALGESGWRDLIFNPSLVGDTELKEKFVQFLREWQKLYKVLPEYKLVVADMQSFLCELRLWLEQIDLGIRSLPEGGRVQAERSILETLIEPTSPAVNSMFERFETVAASVPEELASAHYALCRRQLHPLLLCSPFMYRIYTKPLGFAGDYEMVNMILREPYEGTSLFAKFLNVHILNQLPAKAHRNRVRYLTEKLVEETLRTVRQKRSCKVLNIGCGPAREIEDFLSNCELCNHTDFTLLDMDQEALQFAGKALERAKSRHERRTPIQFIKKGVSQLLKQRGRLCGSDKGYDFIYVAGLFDYLNDRMCRALVEQAYDILAPGGLILATNVENGNPIRHIMEHIYEWHLIHRSGAGLGALAAGLPEGAAVSVKAEETMANVILEVRKPT